MKRIVLILFFSIVLVSLAGCYRFFDPQDSNDISKDPPTQNDPNSNPNLLSEPIMTTEVSPADSSGDSALSEPEKDGYWELYNTEIIVPQNEIIGGGSDVLKYEFSSNATSISLVAERTSGKDVEEIRTHGSWTEPEQTYFAGHTIRINLSAYIDKFERKWTNFSGVNVWAYLGSENTSLGSTTSQVLRDSDGEGTCIASISNGEITVGQAIKEVSIQVPEGSADQKMVILIVVSNQGKQGGVKYYYAWKDW